ncbi:hypothetical protein ANO14919_118150 [Xylariales sp. No.14919]|nr:hypothetical protein ANO14919_118150 [Xylariales sp. No.14919]
MTKKQRLVIKENRIRVAAKLLGFLKGSSTPTRHHQISTESRPECY